MKKIFFIGLVVLVVTGCSLEKRLSRLCPYCPCEQKDSMVYNSEFWVDTIWSVNPMDSALLTALVKCDSLGNAYLYQMNVTEGLKAKIKASIVNNRLTAKSHCPADSLMEIIRYERRQFELYRIQAPAIIKEKEPLNKFFFWWFVASAIIIIVGGIILLMKR